MTTFTQEQQTEHLELLAAYLAAGYTRMKFDMEVFCSDYPPIRFKCGTVACALGHSIDATGVAPEQEDVYWSDYGERVLGICDDRVDANVWFFLFGDSWAHINGQETPKAAADRIAYHLDHKVSYIKLLAELEQFMCEQLFASEHLDKDGITLSPNWIKRCLWIGYFSKSGRTTWAELLEKGNIPILIDA